ncbi:MAG: tetratricopeptide repeat protein [Bacteroidales bacterium]|nr:tetratricopeptide repeat protein [Bacteroidales bacterium]
MKTLKKLGVLSLVIVLFAACGPTKDNALTKISVLEKQLFSSTNSSVNKIKAEELVLLYLDFAKQFPEDSIVPEYLFKAADISMNIMESGKAIEIYDQIITNYPDYSKTPECLFLKGFVYENNLHDLVHAKKYYTEFIDKYPDNDFADDAAMSLINLGKSPEELIKEFEAKMKQQ